MKRHALAKRRDRRKAEQLLAQGVVRVPHQNKRMKGHHVAYRVMDDLVEMPEPVMRKRRKPWKTEPLRVMVKEMVRRNPEAEGPPFPTEEC